MTDKHPIPHLIDSIYGLHGAQYFTSIDFVQGYYHVPLAEESKQYTAFSTMKHHWQFKVLPFGLKNAPSSFQRNIQTIFNNLPLDKVIVYLEDILIIESSFEKSEVP